MSELTAETYPLMPLRDIVLFPGMVAPLVVGRKRSIMALEAAMENRSLIFLVTQKDARVDEPGQRHLYSLGTLASVMQLLRLPDGTIKALVEGKRRAIVVGAFEGGETEESFYSVRLVEAPDTEVEREDVPAYLRELRKAFDQYTQSNKKLPREVLKSITALEDPSRMVDLITSHIQLRTEEKQSILELVSLPQRIAKVLEILYREMELSEMEKDIHAKVKKKMGVTQRNYYLSEKMRAIQEEMGQGEGGDDLGELQQAIDKKHLPKAVKEKVGKEFKKLRQMPPMSAETTVVRNYIDAIISLPWKKKSRSKIDIDRAEQVLNEDHYGLEKPKERILEYLAVQAQVKKIRGPILCLVGPPGVGKTSVCRSIARAMGREFVRLSLGGVRDEAEIRGHRRTYIGAMPGKIILSMQKAGVINPVFCLDEVDKMSVDFRGDPSAALLEVLDPEQNYAFNDHYLDVDYDLSEVFFITTANNLHGIPIPLQDRMEIIQLNGYTEEEKQHIGLEFLLPKQLEANGFKADEITLNDKAILEIIRRYTREAGVRSLERTIAGICRKVARERLKNKEPKKKYRISPQAIERYLGVPKYRHGLAEERDEIGLTTGMAWTEVGGELLQIEATVMPGSGKLTITGKLGDVMQESAQAAMSYVRSRAMRLGLEPDFYQKIDIHVHVPEGAIPKDGPSAGITIATSIVSAILKLPVDRTLAMTGEITLRGRVLPIGGLTEKLLAAKRGNITNVLIPRENERNLRDVPQKIRNSLTIELVHDVDEVLQRALIVKQGETLFKEVPLESIYGDFTISSHNTPAQ
ncbi:ATP-dependent proteinase [Desulfobulbus propionicus DSM 2032]|uniref:Lon protease n=1 Tax=Desulfobulbus propionicus (strain ATCC 33891 / DSM 2032 / VKM B-1956 / 1pr3) TaxID=577650 RepID=A0A7U3YMN2_DESPD|nr:endopeptidase La [Desulfobulbus propionicus]ADW18186.1 ATP-dependent proteinase [Desulfobulbus propionicus DSM 2032]